VLSEAGRAAGAPVTVGRVGPVFTVFFTETPGADHNSARQASAGLYAASLRNMLTEGVLLPPSQWEAAFVSVCHPEGSVLDKTAVAAAESLPAVVAA
jgi:glutamate-1-semialdehyde 2,1-aminomutase